MATVTYTFNHRCNAGSGEHVTFDVQINALPSVSMTWEIEALREPLSALSDSDRQIILMQLIKIHMSGKTRAQIATEIGAGPVVVTI